jgi:hypothetical protein
MELRWWWRVRWRSPEWARGPWFTFSMASMGIRLSQTGKRKNVWCICCVAWVPRGHVLPGEGGGHRALDPPAVCKCSPVLSVPQGIKPPNPPGPEADTCPPRPPQSRFCFHNVPM